MYTVFLARYVGDEEAFLGFVRNHSTAKKLEGFQACIRRAKLRPIVLVTHAGDAPPRATQVKKMGCFVCIIPIVPKYLPGRFLKYLFGILFSALLVARLNKRFKVKCFFCWDFLPDTFLPLRLQLGSIMRRVVVDFEESVERDPRAGPAFQLFERIVRRAGTYRMIGNNREAAKLLGFHPEGIFEGFYARSLREELSFKTRVLEKQFEAATVVFFSGRIDPIRGAREFVEIAKILQEETDIKFIMTGYGDPLLMSEIEAAKPPNIELNFNVSRERYLKLLFSADIAFNYISDQNFSDYSFPSKIIEYLIGAVIVLSNHKVTLHSDRIIGFDDICDAVAAIKKYHVERAERRDEYVASEVIKELSDFSIESGSRQIEIVVDG